MRIDVVPVTSRRDLRRFVDLPWRLIDRKRFPQWVPPLRATVYDALDRAKNPFYADADRELFLAWRDGAVVGRIAAIENRAHNRFHGDRVGFWGFFESVDDQAVADALFDAAERWLSSRGLEVSRGPMNPSTNYECGLLIEGFEQRPSFMTVWNPPYYAALCDRAQLRKAKDLLAYFLPMGDPSWSLPPAFERLAERAVKKSRVVFRDLDLRRFEQELEICWEVYNAAWERNWGFVPMTEREFRHAAKALKTIVDPRIFLFLEKPAGTAVGFVGAIPDVNEIVRDLDGRLFPFGLLRLLARRKRIRAARVMLLGVVPEARGRGVDAALMVNVFESARAAGYRGGEASWILEDNTLMRANLESIGADVVARYRLYETAV